MIKIIYVTIGLAVVSISAGYVAFCSGLQLSGKHELLLNVAQSPSRSTIGVTQYTPEGDKILITAVSEQGPQNQITATVSGTHRYTVALFPTRLVHSFSMNLPVIEWSIRQAESIPTVGYPVDSDHTWHTID